MSPRPSSMGTGTGAGEPRWVAQLETALPGRLRRSVDSARVSWYRVGGPIAVWVDVDDAGEVAAVADVLASLEAAERPALLVVGEGSNLLVADAGFDGLAVHPDRRGALAAIEVHDDLVVAGGAARFPDLARRAADLGRVGLSWAAGIPASTGGAVRMNAGVGQDTVEVANHLEWAEVIDLTTGSRTRRSVGQLGFAYRTSNLRPSELVVAAAFRTEAGAPDRIRADNAEQVRYRKEKQETIRTAGSVWRNPSPSRRAFEMIQLAGAQGLRVGCAQVSEKHANFIVTDGAGSADDVRALMAEVRRRVHRSTGVALQAETVMIGFDDFEELS